jgi:hypothetical protein
VDDAPRTRRLDALRGRSAREGREPLPEIRLRLDLAGWSQRDELLWARRIELPGQAPRVLPGSLLEGTPEADAASDPEELLFFDLETTGLSGGAGTLAFLLGTAWCEGPHLEIEQLFLADYPGEPAFLEAIRERFADRRLFVSFNGRTFDSHILRARFTQNHVPFDIGPQLDLLHVSRRLWRSITGTCTLKALEEQILGVAREVDIPGEEIPLVYFSWLATGAPGLLPVVFEHNLVDVTSLPRLYDAVGRLAGGEAVELPVDCRALGTWLLDRGRVVGVEVLARAFDQGDFDAGIRLGLHFKRGGMWEEAVEVWETMVRETRSLHAAVELAKYHEHLRRDFEAALDRVEAALSWGLPLDARTREELLRRKRRLEARRLRRGRSLPSQAP